VTSATGKWQISRSPFNGRVTTKLQADADRATARLRDELARDLKRLREDAGLSRAAVARTAGMDPSVVSRIEDGQIMPTLETYGRVSAALGATFRARPFPSTGPPIHDRHQVPIAELVLASIDRRRWSPTLEVAVRRPARGWVDLALHDRSAATLVASELESDIRRIEQLLRWSGDKAASLGSAKEWREWSRLGPPTISRLLVVRWTRANRDVVESARRQLREVYSADPRDALEALGGTTATWPGSALLWARVDGKRKELVAG
jgi:transcriptional regulator with XRE-family HTH domain